jgi:predicted ATPase
MYFTRIALKNWRNFVDVDVKLQRRVFLVGPNASGKSNFLDAFKFLRDLVTVGGGFEAAVRERQGMSALRCLSARRQSDIFIAVTLGDEENPTQWEYSLKIKTREKTKDKPELISEIVSNNEKKILERPVKADREDRVLLTETHIEHNSTNQKFREIADYFDKIDYLHLVPQLIRFSDRYHHIERDPYGSDFLLQIANCNSKTRKSRLSKIGEALKKVVPQLTALEFITDRAGRHHLQVRYMHWRSSGAWQNEEQFSDGTLRLIGLLWALQATQSAMLLEEPELSLHPGVVKHIPQLIARVQGRNKKQILLSTHSYELLLDNGIGLDEVLLLRPSNEGTIIEPASSIKQIEMLLRSGSSLAEAVMPYTSPPDVSQLTLFL